MPYFDQVKRFCLFASSGRSGHSIIAHLLTAHPKIMICDELGAVSFFQEGYSREQVFALIKYQDFRHQRRNRRKSGYEYKVEGVWQNVYDKHPEVIGDAKGSRTVRLIADEDGFLDMLRYRLQIPIRILVHLRNPFDILSTQIVKRNLSFEQAVQKFVRFEHKISSTYARLNEDEKLLQYHEDVIANPKESFTKMFKFLGVEPIEKVVNACADKIWEKPNKTRKKIKWQKSQIEKIENCIQQSTIFSSYNFTL